jgi:hypothetical protein
MTLREVDLWIREPAAVPPLPIATTSSIYVHGGFNRLADFIETLRVEMQTLGVSVEITQRDHEPCREKAGLPDGACAAASALDEEGSYDPF